MPRFSPFTNFLTQGMQNTNKNINRMNMPGGGQVFGDPGDYMGGYGGSEGETGGLQGPVLGGGIGGQVGGGEYEPPGSKPWEDSSGFEGLFDQRFDTWEGPTAPPDQPHDPLPPGYEWQWVNGNWEPVQVGTDDPGWQGPQEDPLADYTYYPSTYAPTPIQTPEFAGGGGQGGQAAKKLYYPGTQGGFASVGSGIGGQQNMLDDLLKQLQG